MATYYIATDGDDDNSGTLLSPWLTLNHAWGQVNAGDTIYMRGGTWTYTTMGQTLLSSKDGSAGNYINIWNYPAETPIIDFSDYPNISSGEIIKLQSADYIYLKGIELKHLLQPNSGDFTHVGFRVSSDCNYCIFELLNVHHIGGWGINLYGGSNTAGTASSNNLFLNCDSHHNSDRYSPDPWGGSDGFLINSYDGTAYVSMNNTFRGCRSYWNSDDGWDNRLFNGSLFYDGCWAFWNGYEPGETTEDEDVWENDGGNGYGFKLGSKYIPDDVATVLRTAVNCVSFENFDTGFQYGHNTGGKEADFSCIFYNCSAYGNGQLGFNCSGVDVGTNTLTNCLSYGTTTDYDYVAAACIDTYNASNSTYWYDRNFSCQEADFVSLDSTGVDGARQSDGSLPVLTFMHLAEGSDLIGAGIDVGLTEDCDGVTWNDPPSLGAFEFVEEESSEDLPTGCVPDTNTFTLQDVCNVIGPPSCTLQNCFLYADADAFDPAYEGDHDRLSNFRNYCTLEPPPVYWTITASAEEGGSIDPSGEVSVLEGTDKIFTISEDGGYDIDYVDVDGVSQGAISEYEFTNVTEDHTIDAYFVAEIPAFDAGTIGDADTLCYNTSGSDLYFTVEPSGGVEPYTYQWQEYDGSWGDIVGETGVTYSIPTLTATTQYRCKVTDDASTIDYTNTITITVYSALSAGTICCDETIGYGESPGTISESIAASGGSGSYTYQWQDSEDGITYNDIIGETGTTYIAPILTVDTWYKRIVTDTVCGDTASDSVKITVTAIDYTTKIEIMDIISYPWFSGDHPGLGAKKENWFIVIYKTGINYDDEDPLNITSWVKWQSDNSNLFSLGAQNLSFINTQRCAEMEIGGTGYELETSMSPAGLYFQMTQNAAMLYTNNDSITIGDTYITKNFDLVAGSTTPTTLSLDISEMEYYSNGNAISADHFNITTSPSGGEFWYALCSDDWMEVAEWYSNSSSNIVTLSENTGIERTGTIIVRSVCGRFDNEITVLQRANGYDTDWLGYISPDLDYISDGYVYVICTNNSTVMDSQQKTFYWQTRDENGDYVSGSNFTSDVLNHGTISHHNFYTGSSGWVACYISIDQINWYYFCSL